MLAECLSPIVPTHRHSFIECVITPFGTHSIFFLSPYVNMASLSPLIFGFKTHSIHQRREGIVLTCKIVQPLETR